MNRKFKNHSPINLINSESFMGQSNFSKFKFYVKTIIAKNNCRLNYSRLSFTKDQSMTNFTIERLRIYEQKI